MAISAILMMTALASSGSCPGTFEQVAEATEDNYAGYIVKLPDDDARNVYRRFRGMMANTAATAMDHDACRQVLEAYVGFFADHHLFVASREDAVSPIPSLTGHWTEATAARYFSEREDVLDPVEGFWREKGGRIAVVRDAALAPGRYVAIRMDGERQATAIALVERRPGGYRIRYRHPDWGWQEVDAMLRRSGDLLTFGTEGWGRAHAGNLDMEDPMAPWFSAMGNGIYYLSMPSFMPQHREKLLQIIAENGSLMADASGLIVDVRGNAGGDAIYFPLAPYFLANDIRISEPSSVRASKWTIGHFEALRDMQGEQGAWLDAPLENMRSHPGQIVAFREGSVDGIPQYPENPGQVVVLQDRGVGSAAEAFIYHAGQSAKVVTMGEPTRGNIDYMQVSMHRVGSGVYQYWFGYPLYFRSGLPAASVDDEGYAPDIRLGLPEDDWLSFARQWLSDESDDGKIERSGVHGAP